MYLFKKLSTLCFILQRCLTIKGKIFWFLLLNPNVFLLFKKTFSPPIRGLILKAMSVVFRFIEIILQWYKRSVISWVFLLILSRYFSFYICWNYSLTIQFNYKFKVINTFKVSVNLKLWLKVLSEITWL